MKRKKKKNVLLRDFLSGTVGKNPPGNAGDTGYDPWSRKIPHATEQLIPCAATTETPGPRACALHKRSRGNERPVLCNWRVALQLSETGESLWAARKTQLKGKN